MTRSRSRSRQLVLPLLVAAGVVALVAAAARSPVHPVPAVRGSAEFPDADAVVGQVNRLFEARWTASQVEPAAPADDLAILRRMSLALHGTVPSLEELRRFEADRDPDRIERWALQLLRDRRFNDYFAARLARSLIGAEQGQFIIFRRDRFTTWLSEQLAADRPYDELVREMIADDGLWTGRPATNFITQAVTDGTLDPNKLAGRTVRAFLGQRIDCAQCHNHPFADWKQDQFAGLAACYGQAVVTPVGINDNPKRTFELEDRKTLEKRAVDPAPPFGQEWWPNAGDYRERLAHWVTHPDNRRFERAIVNRVWGLVYGRPWLEPVDDLPHPSADADPQHDLLDLLGADFRRHGCDLKRLVFMIVTARPFRLSSEHPAYETGEQSELVEQQWAAFPLVRLRPEQMIGAMLQAASIKTIDQNSHLFTRFLRFVREQDFVRDYGNLGERELEDRAGTIPQALLRMNGRFASELGNASPLNATARIAGMAASDEACVETAFLCCVARRPTPEERSFYLVQLSGAKRRSRADVVEDIFWALFNSPEFCWNH